MVEFLILKNYIYNIIALLNFVRECSSVNFFRFNFNNLAVTCQVVKINHKKTRRVNFLRGNLIIFFSLQFVLVKSNTSTHYFQ